MIRDKGEAEKVKHALWQTIRKQGYGAVRRTEKKLGKDPETLKHMKIREGGLYVREVTAVLNALDIPHSVFFNEVFGGVETSAVDRFMAKGAEMAHGLVRKKRVVLPELAEETTPDRLTDEELERLDALRFEDPHAAASEAAAFALEAAREGRRGDAAAAMARQGSALRVAERWDEAWVCVWWAMKHAPEGASRANALLRSGSIVSDYGKFDDAAELAQEAVVANLYCGSSLAAARAIVSQGVFLRLGGRYAAAINCLNAALKLLPRGESLNRFTAHQCLGLAYLNRNQVDLAENQANQAEAVGVSGPPFEIDLLWLRARIASECREHAAAAKLYRKVCDRLTHAPGNAALAAAELCDVLLEGRRFVEAKATALAMAALAMPKSQNRIVCSAILGLFQAAQVGDLNQRLVGQAILRIKDGIRRRALLGSKRAARRR